MNSSLQTALHKLFRARSAVRMSRSGLLPVGRQSVRNLGHHFPEARGELSVRRTAARMKRLFWGIVAAPKSYRARVGIDLCSDFNEVAFRVAHHRFVVSVSSYPRTSSYGHSGCAHGSY